MPKWMILLGFVALAAFWAQPIASWWSHPVAAFFGRREFWWDAEDFVVFYAAGTFVAHGNVGSLYDATAHASIQLPLLVGHDEPLGFYNPPLFALVFVPFSWLPYEQAFQALTAVNVVLCGFACALLWRIADPLDRTYRLMMIAGFLTMYPLTFVFRLGQFSLILVASWGAAFLYLRAGRDRAAGFALGPMLIKPELLIPVVIFLAWKRQWRTLRPLLMITAAAVAMSAVMLGPHGTWDYTTHISSAAGEGSGNMYGWNGLLASSFAASDPGSMTSVSMPIALVTLCGAALLWRVPLAPRSYVFPAQWLALTLATVLWDPHFYMQDLIILVPPAVAVLAAATGWRQVVTAAALVLGWMILGLGSTPSQSWGVNITAIYLVVCLAAMVGWHVAAGASRARLEAEVALGNAPNELGSIAA